MICTALEMQVMTPELFERYKNVKSSKGFTLSNAIQVPPAPPVPRSRSLSRPSPPRCLLFLPQLKRGEPSS
jgi:hypothetical protein